ncbi:MAG: hypothetical protein ACOCUD_03195 [Bacillota bacterium]
MKNLIKVMLLLLTIFVLSSCKLPYRVYNDEDLQDMAVSGYDFSEYLVFKIVDPETALFMTGTKYQNSGVIIGIKDEEYSMLFVPKRISKEAFIVMESFTFNLDDIYEELNSLEDDFGSKLYYDPANDYGGLSISVNHYEDITLNNPDLNFDSEIIFTFTTDVMVFYVGYVEGEIFVFNSNNRIIN